jgi:hypothetical protein
MPKTNGKNNWNVSYCSITFFECVLNSHKNVVSHYRTSDILFKIKRIHGDELTVLLVNEYILGEMRIYRALQEFPKFEYIVNCGDWNSYTPEAKELGRKSNIGIFVISEFLAALHLNDPKLYVKKDKDGNPEY